MRALPPLVVAVGLALAACSGLGGSPTPVSAHPADFALEYHWQEGSVPPPHHYEYFIRLGPGPRGEIVFVPDYDFRNPPAWTEPLAVTEADLTDLYRLLVEQGVFTRQWQALDPPPVGGSFDSLEVTAEGRQVSIPGLLIEDEEASIAKVYEAIRALVPQATWDKLYALQAEYQQAYPEDA
jgi:hypothetical protein